ncbi:hypothetical protein JKP88DRAFT_270645 [Tribonema minus]|uniref:Glutamate synthase domain-containing protein n=1 Tax=Tribonema minus TaxID=303371 RepID=A0A835YM27_9STRA|nr:hypothetical protein JKP88DRAFT_270645 [Tribonema minus]
MIGATAVLFVANPAQGAIAAVPVALFWYRGLKDMAQDSHTVLRNFPVLGHIRFLLEASDCKAASLRPEIRQYFIESDTDSVPFSRAQRSIVYQRAKLQTDNLPFGTRRNTYGEGYEWIKHSLSPVHLDDACGRKVVGGPHCKQPYSASIMNVSAMSYGSISKNAVLALNGGAKMGGFYHNTGEGGLSKYHLEPGGDIVWNIGTGYFGCRAEDGSFSPTAFSANASRPQVKMIEIKLSQGAKPAHGGILPAAKVSADIAEARGVPQGMDCISPPGHSEFAGPAGLVRFADRSAALSDAPSLLCSAFISCVGNHVELAGIVRAMQESGSGPDFINIDGGEGGTGAAPPEFSNSVGTPLVDAVALATDLLIGAGIRERVTVICAGKVLSGFSIVRNMALGADICNSARAMMFALGCIQASRPDTLRNMMLKVCQSTLYASVCAPY